LAVSAESPRGRLPTAVTAVVAVVVVTLLGVAGFVIVTNARQVTTGPVPDAIVPRQRDTSYAGLHRLLAYKLGVLRRRYVPRRDSLSTRTPLQETLIRSCDSSIAATQVLLAAMDTVRTGRGRKAAGAEVRHSYEAAREVVARFMATVRFSESLDEDSLDQEMKKLIGD
jgi:hypothetical protein